MRRRPRSELASRSARSTELSGPSFIKDAAREANRAGDLDLLCVLAFAFDPARAGNG